MVNEGQTSINIPQIIAVAVVGFLAIRWWMSKPTTGGTSGSSSRSRAVDPAKVDQVSSMFPQLDRRSIAWDLQRNGGSVEATTERVLGGRGLETPPPTFQPNLPTPATAARSSAAKSEMSRPDLITRYGLQSKVSGKGKGKEPVPSEEQKRNASAWSSDKAARAEGLKKRREEMILAARRKMMEKDNEVES
ncbi:Coupling of ubiquitin conjugation to ER degradation protein 1 [Pseudocercospora fuligena]|uniref:Coupling of ubiquitin conjugation to ER degradation protein 1 n=1 Tax=Pseudocercospora fuligena TaxID=685502 RepID=A0A8H6VQ20_9PEZI|nr:Coupling of ubiquitin conjugation to ER degradation protein 1 [Pseudocercospora fuligena]